MKRKIVEINEEKCTGCGLCAEACHEGAIKMINGKAKLIRDDYCDGFGDCLPACPADAIRIIEREALPYDEEAVKAKAAAAAVFEGFQCPGSKMRELKKENASPAAESTSRASELKQWPCQIKLVNPAAPYFRDADLLIAADCTAYAYAAMHERFMRGRVTVIGCPKLDSTDYSEKLEAIIRDNDIKSVKIVKMEVPCCTGIENMAKEALKRSGKFIPWNVVTVSLDGRILSE